ncbi:hypothetical protein GIB67_018913 [Kingdonia uniflora]|uniref:Pentatricopeptide repeat-containing protein n=1 Tax=Kingdonia uniflora TaxID=39325 RepID=A0A7J7L2V0_9MAGN|nr:hypothetical protein GIB67_018913 [Kingdonia uniflora]
MWEEMKSKGYRPTIVSYTTFIKVLFDHNKGKEATEVYKEMLVSICSPNCYTYTVLMEYIVGSGKFIMAFDIFNKMQEAGVLPDKATCNILVAALGEGVSLEAKLLSRREYLSCQKDVLSLKFLIGQSKTKLKFRDSGVLGFEEPNRALAYEEFGVKMPKEMFGL